MEQARIVGCSVEEHETIGSTNDRILELAAAEAPEGTVVSARAQSAGRGRLGRQWRSGAGKGLYLSVLLRPRLPAGALGLLSLAAGAAVRRTLARTCGLAGQIKWPNDVLVGGRKIAGVLIEGRSGAGGSHILAVGIGINTDWDPADREGEFRVPPTAVKLETGSAAPVRELRDGLFAALDTLYRELQADGGASLLAEVHEHLHRRGETVTLELAGRRVSGVLEGLDRTGGLVLRGADGESMTFHSGELAVC